MTGYLYYLDLMLTSGSFDLLCITLEAQDDGVVAKIIVAAGGGEIPCGT